MAGAGPFGDEEEEGAALFRLGLLIQLCFDGGWIGYIAVVDGGDDDDDDGGGGSESYRSAQKKQRPCPKNKSPSSPISWAASSRKKKFRHICASIASPTILASASGLGLNDNSYSALTAPSSRLGHTGGVIAEYREEQE